MIVTHTYGAMQHAFGYASVSATDQNLATQVEDLTHAGCTRILQEKVSGTRTHRPASTSYWRPCGKAT